MRALARSTLITFMLLFTGALPTPAWADDCGGVSCKCMDCSPGEDTSDSRSDSSNHDAGSWASMNARDLWGYHPTTAQSVVYWLPIVALDSV